MSKNALIIDDDPAMFELIAKPVQSLGYVVHHASDGSQGVSAAEQIQPALIILDLNLPEMPGIEVCKILRGKGVEVPIIVVSSHADLTHKVLLLEFGADDYITKPFDDLELVARVKAVVRRFESRGTASATASEIIRYRGLEIDLEKRRVSRDGELIEITAREFDLLSLMAAKPGRPFTRQELIEHVYGCDTIGYEQTVYTQMNRLRNKLEIDPAHPKYILTVRGVGYCFADEAE